MSRVLAMAWLVGVWVALWGRLTVANVVSGVAVAVVVLVALPNPRQARARYVLRPLAAARLGGYFAVKLLQANLALAAAVLAPRSRSRTGVVAVPLVGCSDGVLTLVANMAALVPGTMTVEVVTDPPTFYVHVLQLDDVDAVRRDVGTLEALAIRAFVPADEIRSLNAAAAKSQPPSRGGEPT